MGRRARTPEMYVERTGCLLQMARILRMLSAVEGDPGTQGDNEASIRFQLCLSIGFSKSMVEG